MKSICWLISIITILLLVSGQSLFAQEKADKIQLEGNLEIIIADDFLNKETRTFHFLNVGKENIPVYLSEKIILPPDITSGKRVRLKGRWQKSAPSSAGAKSAVSSKFLADELRVIGEPSLPISKRTSQKASQSAVSSSFVLGEQKTLVVLLEFPDQPRHEWDETTIENAIFNDPLSVDAIFREMSQNRVWLTGKVLGWQMMPKPAVSYGPEEIDTMQFGEIAYDAISVIDPEIDFTSYERLILILGGREKKGESFTYFWPASFAIVGKSGYQTADGKIPMSVAWINGMGFDWYYQNNIDHKYSKVNETIHEVGHNFGLWHATGWVPEDQGDCRYCSDLLNLKLYVDLSNWAATCEVMTYQDGYDIMGAYGQFSGQHKAQLGWLDSGQILTVGSADMTIWLDQRALPSYGIKMIKIPLGISTHGQKMFYFLEYFRPLGLFDSQAEKWLDDDKKNVVPLRFWPGKVVGNGDSIKFNSYYHPSNGLPPILSFGTTFCDPERGVSIEAIESRGEDAQSQALVKISFNCPTEIAPSLNVAPLETQNVLAGSTANYTLKIENKEEMGCGSKTYNLQTVLPESWKAEFNQPVITLEPYGETQATLTVTISASDEGEYQIPITLVSADNPEIKTEAVVTINVQALPQPLRKFAVVLPDDSVIQTVRRAPLSVKIIVSEGDKKVSGALVRCKIVNDKTGRAFLDQQAATDSRGRVRFIFRITKKNPPGGIYGVEISVAKTEYEDFSGSFRFRIPKIQW